MRPSFLIFKKKMRKRKIQLEEEEEVGAPPVPAEKEVPLEETLVEEKTPAESAPSFWLNMMVVESLPKGPQEILKAASFLLKSTNYSELRATYLNSYPPLTVTSPYLGDVAKTKERLAAMLAARFHPHKARPPPLADAAPMFDLALGNSAPSEEKKAQMKLDFAIRFNRSNLYICNNYFVLNCKTGKAREWESPAEIQHRLEEGETIEAWAKQHRYRVRGPGLLTAAGLFFYLDGKIVPCDKW